MNENSCPAANDLRAADSPVATSIALGFARPALAPSCGQGISFDPRKLQRVRRLRGGTFTSVKKCRRRQRFDTVPRGLYRHVVTTTGADVQGCPTLRVEQQWAAFLAFRPQNCPRLANARRSN